MGSSIKLGIIALLVILFLPLSYAASCTTTPSGVGEITQAQPNTDQLFEWGVVDSNYDGVNRVLIQSISLYDSSADPECTFITPYHILFNPYDFYDLLGGVGSSKPYANFDTWVLLNVPGVYRWKSQVIPHGSGCSELLCETPLRQFAVDGPTLPSFPSIDTISPSDGQTYTAGTTSTSVQCGGECPDRNGCDVYIFDNEGGQLLHDTVSQCLGTNCWTVGPVTYSGLNDGQSYTTECQVIDSHGQEDSYTVGFSVDGGTCAQITTDWGSTPASGTILSYPQEVIITGSPFSNPSYSLITPEFYMCKDFTNTCTPQLTYTGLMGTDGFEEYRVTFSSGFINDGEYVRWYVKYTDIPGCPDQTPRSVAGNSVSWFQVTSGGSNLDITLSNPINDSSISDTSPDFIFTTTSSQSTSTNKLYVNDQLKRTASQSIGANSFTNVDLGGPGDYEWYVVADDGIEQVTSDVWSFIVTQGPQITLLSPSDGATFADGISSVNLQWRVTSSTATTDRLFVNGNLQQTFSPTTNLNRNYNLPVSGGTYNWYINSTDQNGVSSVSGSRSFTVNCTSVWVLQQGQCLPTNQQLITWIDMNNCGNPVPINLTPANGTYVDCHYCSDNWICSSFDDCQPENNKPCLSITNAGAVPCTTAYPGSISDFDETCQYASEGDVIGFTSFDLVDLDDPFNKGILPDMFFGLVAFFSTPFLYWLLWICVALVIFLSAVVILMWVKANT